MAGTTLLRESVYRAVTAAPYASAYDHLVDELRCLDLLIRRAVVKLNSRRGDDTPGQFKGLVISDEDVEGILSRGCAADDLSDLPAADLAVLKRLDAELHDLRSLIDARVAASEQGGFTPPLLQLAREFALPPFACSCLVVCLAPELDRRYEKLYGYLHDDITRKLPTPGLAMDLLSRSFEERVDARAAFTPQAPLFRHRLISFLSAPDSPHSSLSRPLKIDERIAGFLTGSDDPDGRIIDFATLSDADPGLDLVTLPEAERNRLYRFARHHAEGKGDRRKGLVLHLHGPDGTGRRQVAQWLSRRLGMPQLLVDLEKMQVSGTAVSEGIERIFREARLQGASICLDRFDTLTQDTDGDRLRGEIAAMVDVSPLTLFLIATTPWQGSGRFIGAHFLSIGFTAPDTGFRKGFWEREAARGGRVEAGVDYGALAGRFRFTPGQVRDAIAAAEDVARSRRPDHARISEHDLFTACREQSAVKMGGFARKIVPGYHWHDLVLAESRMEQLREICNHSRYRHIVFGDWGFERKLSYGKGLNALFTGPPGTGKTMAAEVVANELRLDLYKIDLSRVVSKYIGETEKNLSAVFEMAGASNAILFFDEADALFGKRSEVKDAHDRYANIEIGYLLQKMEEYEGIAILATNLRGNLDEAFVRRMQFIVEFPFPQEKERRAIWQRIWPETTPRCDSLDPELLAKRFEISGGSIRNIALAAAFMAAGEEGVIGMDHLVRAAGREFLKMGKIVDESHFDR